MATPDLPFARRRFLAENPRSVPLLIFALVATITGVSVASIEAGERAATQLEFDRRAQAIGASVERRASTNAALLRAGSALFSLQDEVSPTMFRQFVAELRLDTDYEGNEGIGWAPLVSANAVPALERRLSVNRTTPFRVRPSLAELPRGELAPIIYLQPDTMRNRRALGFDLTSEAVRREALDEAALNDRPTATGPIRLVQSDGGRKTGFLIIMPVYDRGDSGRLLRGYIYSPFEAERFLQTAAEVVRHDDMTVSLVDQRGGRERQYAAIGSGVHSGLSSTRPVIIANHAMLLKLRSTRKEVLSTLSMITLLFGMAVASLLLFIVRLLARQAREDRQSIERLAQQNSIRNTLTRELNHRVKNTLANVLSIIALTRRRATNLEEFAEGIDGRIRALSATHDLLTQSEWSTTPVRSVIEAELGPYTRHDGHEVTVEGPDVDLAPNDALSLGLAVHELATNAAKYGALSVPDGRVVITWAMVGEHLTRVQWTETRGPTVIRPSRRGFGTDLLEKIVAHELRHPVELEFAAEGVRCTLLVPVRHRGEFALREGMEPVRGH